MNKLKELLEKKNSKIIIEVLLASIMIIMFLLFLPKAHDDVVKDNGIKAHTEEGIVKEEEYKGIKFSNISMITEKGYTTFTADVTNVSGADIDTERLHIDLKDKDGKVVIKLLAYIPNGLKSGEVKKVNASAKGEFKEIVSKEIVD